MIPGFAIRLDSMSRALSSVIMPAIDPENRLAQEQAALMLGQLAMMSGQWDKVERYTELCHADLVSTAQALNPEGGAVTAAAAQALSDTLSTAQTPSEAAFRDISAMLERLVHAVDEDGNDSFRHQLHKEVLEFGKRQAFRDRAWFAACGFDVNAGELPTIEDLIRQGR
jgi:hypothetical protein